MTPDFTPTSETISLHGLGFIQVKLPRALRLHVWHPELPRRGCYMRSAVHNHRFGFRSKVIKGVQVNQRCQIEMHPEGTHTVISHNGPRAESGSRVSFPAGRVNLHWDQMEFYIPGDTYYMSPLEYHHTPNRGIVVTLMEKLDEGRVHASSLIEHPYEFDQEFDRFQMSPEALWNYVVEALSTEEIWA